MLGETGRQVMGPMRGSGDFLAYGSPSISADRAFHNVVIHVIEEPRDKFDNIDNEVDFQLAPIVSVLNQAVVH